MIFPEREKLRCWQACLLAGLFALCACGEVPERSTPGVGARFPDVELAGLTHQAPISTLRGSALVVNVWATWCGPCRAEMPALERLSQRLAARGVRVLAVTVDQDLNLVREFVREHRLTIPVYVDPKDKVFQSVLRVRALPETLLVGPDGVIAARLSGVRDWNGPEGDRLLQAAFKLPPEAHE